MPLVAHQAPPQQAEWSMAGQTASPAQPNGSRPRLTSMDSYQGAPAAGESDLTAVASSCLSLHSPDVHRLVHLDAVNNNPPTPQSTRTTLHI